MASPQRGQVNGRPTVSARSLSGAWHAEQVSRMKSKGRVPVSSKEVQADRLPRGQSCDGLPVVPRHCQFRLMGDCSHGA